MFTKRRALVAAEPAANSLSLASPALPLIITPEQLQGQPWSDWLQAQHSWLEQRLLEHGAVLFRGFPIEGSTGFADWVHRLSTEDLLPYQFRSTPRTAVSGHIYTSTEYPSDQLIPQHNEQSYTSQWPLKIYFFCDTPPDYRGETPICDSRLVYQLMPADIRAAFASKGIRYLRNYSELDLDYREVFGSADPAEIGRQCRLLGIEYSWSAQGRLSTAQTLPAVRQHPVTGQWLWFNQAHLFHVSARGPEVAEALIDSYGLAALPRHACFGDGSEIPADYIRRINQVFAQCQQSFPWQKNDLLYMDNMLAAHGRRDFRGARKILVAMTHLYSLPSLLAE
jgi:alpha-ketoglutarate-dependent taurine dioxygenase